MAVNKEEYTIIVITIKEILQSSTLRMAVLVLAIKSDSIITALRWW